MADSASVISPKNSEKSKLSNLINRTTSETLRLNDIEKVVNSQNSVSTNAPRKKTSFQITSVIVGSRASNDGGDDSADDLDESHAEDISEVLDNSRITDLENETPSYSEDTFSKDDVFFNASSSLVSAPVIPTSSQYGLAIVATPEHSESALNPSDNCENSDSVDASSVDVPENVINLGVVSTKHDPEMRDMHPPAPRTERFKVVKIESTEPFKRGRWVCMDYLDHNIAQKDQPSVKTDTGDNLTNSTTEPSSTVPAEQVITANSAVEEQQPASIPAEVVNNTASIMQTNENSQVSNSQVPISSAPTAVPTSYPSVSPGQSLQNSMQMGHVVTSSNTPVVSQQSQSLSQVHMQQILANSNQHQSLQPQQMQQVMASANVMPMQQQGSLPQPMQQQPVMQQPMQQMQQMPQQYQSQPQNMSQQQQSVPQQQTMPQQQQTLPPQQQTMSQQPSIPTQQQQTIPQQQQQTQQTMPQQQQQQQQQQQNMAQPQQVMQPQQSIPQQQQQQQSIPQQQQNMPQQQQTLPQQQQPIPQQQMSQQQGMPQQQQQPMQQQQFQPMQQQQQPMMQQQMPQQPMQGQMPVQQVQMQPNVQQMSMPPQNQPSMQQQPMLQQPIQQLQQQQPTQMHQVSYSQPPIPTSQQQVPGMMPQMHPQQMQGFQQGQMMTNLQPQPIMNIQSQPHLQPQYYSASQPMPTGIVTSQPGMMTQGSMPQVSMQGATPNLPPLQTYASVASMPQMQVPNMPQTPPIQTSVQYNMPHMSQPSQPMTLPPMSMQQTIIPPQPQPTQQPPQPQPAQSYAGISSPAQSYTHGMSSSSVPSAIMMEHPLMNGEHTDNPTAALIESLNEVTAGADEIQPGEDAESLRGLARALSEAAIEPLSQEFSTSGANAVAIDNKIEQAMDLVKSHLMYAVREEVEVLKEKIAELMDRIGQLEAENATLRAGASPETLALLQTAPQNNATNNP